MDVLTFTAIVFVGSVAAGFLGSLTGLGGGVVIVPLLTIALGVNIRYAIGASLVSVIATSSGAAAAYLKEGFTNMRIGILLEVATVGGAVGGATLATIVSPSAIETVFGAVLLLSVVLTLHSVEPAPIAPQAAGRLVRRLRLGSSYPSTEGPVAYAPRRLPLGFGIMAIAGALSGLLGIGSGAVKVLALDQAQAAALQGLDDDQQLHDRRHRRGQCRHLPEARLHRSRPRHAGHAGRARRLPRRGALPPCRQDPPATLPLCGRHPRPRCRDDRYGALRMTDQAEGRWSDRTVERVMGTVLRSGVIVAAALVVAGGVLYLLHSGHAMPYYGVFRGVASSLRNPKNAVRGLLEGRPAALIEVGLIVLILTPIARVAFSALAFAAQRDRLYVVLALMVLAVLVLGLLGYTR